MSKNNLELIRQALSAAESSLKLAKQLLMELEGSGMEAKPKAAELPGILGIFDGENMVAETGDNFPVPANYASKSMLVVGDTLKLVEEGKEKRFKQIEHVKRHKTIGILAKKDGKWKAVTPEGSYKVLPAAVAHFGGDIGSEVTLHLPSDNLTVPYGAIESVKGGVKTEGQSQQVSDNHEEVEKEVEKQPVIKENVVEKEPTHEKTEEPKEKKEAIEINKPQSAKFEPKQLPKVEPHKPEPKKVEPAVEVPKVTTVFKPEPLKAITVEPEPKLVPVESKVEPKIEAPKPASVPVSIEIAPEEDELT